MKLPEEGTRWILLNRSRGNFSRFERSEKGQIFAVFLLFCQFSQKRLDNIYFIFSIQLLGDILVNFQEMDLIELSKRSFSRSERSGLTHFPIIIDIIQW